MCIYIVTFSYSYIVTLCTHMYTNYSTEASTWNCGLRRNNWAISNLNATWVQNKLSMYEQPTATASCLEYNAQVGVCDQPTCAVLSKSMGISLNLNSFGTLQDEWTMNGLWMDLAGKDRKDSILSWLILTHTCWHRSFVQYHLCQKYGKKMPKIRANGKRCNTLQLTMLSQRLPILGACCDTGSPRHTALSVAMAAPKTLLGSQQHKKMAMACKL